MNDQALVQVNQFDFFELLHQEFLSFKGYGAGAFLSAHSIALLFKQYLSQHVSVYKFIKQVVRQFR